MNNTGNHSRVNPLLKGVNPTPAPRPQVSWLSTYPDIIGEFNDFRNSSISRLHNSTELDSPEEALSLNGIMHVSNSSSRQYEYIIADWENICRMASSSEINKHYVRQHFLEMDLSLISTIITPFKNQCRTRLSNNVSFTRSLTNSYLHGNYSPFVKNTCKMLINFADKIGYNWDSTTMSEDTLAVNVFDPAYEAFLAGIPLIENHGADHFVQESKARKRQLAASLNEPTTNVNGRKPHRSLQWCFQVPIVRNPSYQNEKYFNSQQHPRIRLASGHVDQI